MRYYLWLLMLLIVGCGLFENTTKTTQQSHQRLNRKAEVKIADEKGRGINLNGLSFYRDSSNQDYSVQLWPKGSFAFSAARGFEGEADSILIRGKLGQLVTASNLFQLQQQDKQRTEMRGKTTEKVVSDQKEEVKVTSPSWKWIVGGFILIVVVGVGLKSCFGVKKYEKIQV